MQNFFYLVEENDWLSNELFPLVLNMIIAIIPSLILCIYVYKKDVIEKEPMPMLLTLFVLGVVVTIPASFMEQTLMTSLDIKPIGITECLIVSFLIVGLIEEGYKFGPYGDALLML